MPIGIRGTTPATSTVATPTVAVTLTSARQPQAGDLLVIIHSNDWFTLTDMPTPTVGGSTTGVTAITSGSADGGSFEPHAKSYTYVVNATGDLAVSVTETSTGDEEKSLVVYVLSGADTTTPVEAAATSVDVSGATAQVAPSVSPASTDDLLICHVSTGNGGTGTSYTPPGGMTEVYDFDLSASYSASGATQQLSASGATGTRTFTATTSAHYAGLTIAVKTASGAPVETNYARPNTTAAPGRRGPTGRLTPQAPGSARTASSALIGVATETDTALPAGRTHTRAVGIAGETDTALAPGRTHARTVGIASGTDTALSVARAKTRTAGPATETDAAQAVGKAKAKALGVAAETDTAQPVTAPVATRHNLSPNPACGSNVTGWGGGSTPTQATGLTGLPVTTGARYTVNGYAQTPTAVAVASQQYTASVYVSNNTAISLGTKTIYLAFARSSGGDDFSQTSTADLVTGVTRASVTGTAPALTTGVYVVVDSFNAALGSGVDITACLIEQTGTLSAYFDGNSPGARWDGATGNSTSSIGPSGATAGTATETDTAMPVGRSKARALGSAAETSTALSVGRTHTRVVGPAAETDAAQPVGVAASVVQRYAGPYLGPTPGWISPTGSLAPQAAGSTTLGNVTTRTLGVAAGTDAALPLGRAKTRTAAAATETDTALPAGRVKTRTVGIAATTDTAVTAGHTKRRLVGVASETDAARPVSTPGHLVAAIGTAAETSTAIAAGRGKRRTAGVATTVEAALALTRRKTRPVGAATSVDTAGTVRDAAALINQPGVLTLSISAPRLIPSTWP